MSANSPQPKGCPKNSKAREHEAYGVHTIDQVAYEVVLMTRYAAQALPAIKRETILDRSALILLSRLDSQGPMTVNELAEAFALNASTVHRQLKAAIVNGLIETIDHPDTPAKLHRPTPLGLKRLRQELCARREDLHKIYADWADEDIEQFARLIRKHNQSVEDYLDLPWPRSY